MKIGFDVSDPGAAQLRGYDVAGGYLGGNTPHVWTRGQWDAQDARWRAPFWVPHLDVPGDQQAAEIKTAMDSLGAPRWALVFLDMEAAVHPLLVNAIGNGLTNRGLLTGVYGSEADVFGNPPRSGYFVALWDGVQSLYEHPHAVAKQYANNVTDKSGVVVDLSVYADACPLWDTRPVTSPPPPSWAANAAADLNNAAQLVLAARSAIITNVK